MNPRVAVSMVGLSAIAVSSVLYMNVLGLGLEPSPYNREAEVTVPDISGLLVGSKVLMRGVPIGEIAALRPHADGVDVTWKYDDDYRIPADSRYRIDMLSALGEPYLAVNPPGTQGPYLEDSAVVPAGQVTVPTTVQELSARLTRVLDQVDPEQVRAIIGELDTALPDDGLVLVDLSRAWSLFAQMASAQKDDLAVVLDKVQALLADSAWLPGSLTATSVDLRRLGVDMGLWLSHSATDVVKFAPFPEGISEGTGPFINELQKFLDKASPGLQVLGVATLPAVRAAAGAIATVNIAQLLDSAITDSAGGAVSVHVGTTSGN